MVMFMYKVHGCSSIYCHTCVLSLIFTVLLAAVWEREREGGEREREKKNHCQKVKSMCVCACVSARMHV